MFGECLASVGQYGQGTGQAAATVSSDNVHLAHRDLDLSHLESSVTIITDEGGGGESVTNRPQSKQDHLTG